MGTGAILFGAERDAALTGGADYVRLQKIAPIPIFASLATAPGK
jgi:hypothetical protein